MTFNRTTRDLETIAELANARAPVTNAAAVGISEDEFRDWCQRLAAARMYGFPVLAAKATPAAKRAGPVFEESPGRIMAERIFAKP